MIPSVMATTELGSKVEQYINGELRRLGVDAFALVVEGPDNLDFGVHIHGARVSRRFVLKDGYAVGLSESAKETIASVLSELTETH